MFKETIKGDLIHLAKQGCFDAIVHGCNCQATMGAGIAPQIAAAFEGVREADKNFHIPVGSIARLGKYSVAPQKELALDVINAYTQFTFTGRREGKVDVSYEAIASVFSSLNEAYKGRHLGIPMIGAGLAGGHWEAIYTIINLVATDVEITFVVYQP